MIGNNRYWGFEGTERKVKYDILKIAYLQNLDMFRAVIQVSSFCTTSHRNKSFYFFLYRSLFLSTTFCIVKNLLHLTFRAVNVGGHDDSEVLFLLASPSSASLDIFRR